MAMAIAMAMESGDVDGEEVMLVWIAICFYVGLRCLIPNKLQQSSAGLPGSGEVRPTDGSAA